MLTKKRTLMLAAFSLITFWAQDAGADDLKVSLNSQARQFSQLLGLSATSLSVSYGALTFGGLGQPKPTFNNDLLARTEAPATHNNPAIQVAFFHLSF